MSEFNLLARHTVRTTGFVTLFAIALWALLPMPWRPLLAGFAIGSAISLFYAFSAARQIESASLFARERQKRGPGIAGFSRLAVVALGGFVVSRIHASIGMFLFGMFVSQLVIYVTLFLQGRAKKTMKRKG